MMQTGKNVLFLILIQRIVYFAAFAADKESLSRSAYFTTHENRRLKGHVVKRFASPSLMSCSKLCLTNSWCTSTNFKMSSKEDGKGTCELNKHDISVIYEDNEFHDQDDVKFMFPLLIPNYFAVVLPFSSLAHDQSHKSKLNLLLCSFSYLIVCSKRYWLNLKYELTWVLKFSNSYQVNVNDRS